MIRRLLCILFLCVFLMGCSTQNYLNSNGDENSSVQTQAAPQDLRIINSRTTLRLGEAGFITIQGEPGVRYTIKTSFRMGNHVIPVTQWRVAGTNGQATFNWVVSQETVPGTYSGTISGGGRTIQISHTVVP